MRWMMKTLCVLLLGVLPSSAWARGGHGGGGGHAGGGGHSFGGHSYSGHSYSGGHFSGHPAYQGYSGFRGRYYGSYGGYGGYGGYRGWGYYGWGWHRPYYWPAYWMGGYWSPLWPVYEVWPFYNVRIGDPDVVVNNTTMMAPLEPRYYYHDTHPTPESAEAPQELVALTQMEPVFSGPQGAEYNVHRENQDPPLVLGKASYPTGFAVSAPSTLRFALPGGPGTLKVHFGLMLRSDDGCETAATGGARFVIVGDGKELFSSEDSGGNTVQLPVAGVRSLELRIVPLAAPDTDSPSAADAGALRCAWGVWAEPEITPHP